MGMTVCIRWQQLVQRAKNSWSPKLLDCGSWLSGETSHRRNWNLFMLVSYNNFPYQLLLLFLKFRLIIAAYDLCPVEAVQNSVLCSIHYRKYGTVCYHYVMNIPDWTEALWASTFESEAHDWPAGGATVQGRRWHRENGDVWGSAHPAGKTDQAATQGGQAAWGSGDEDSAETPWALTSHYSPELRVGYNNNRTSLYCIFCLYNCWLAGNVDDADTLDYWIQD